MTTEIIMTADTYENMTAACIAAIEPTLTARERRAGCAMTQCLKHQSDVVSGRVDEADPVDASPAEITISNRLVAIRRADCTIVLAGGNKVRKDEEYFPVSTVVENTTDNVVVWLGGRQVCVTLEQAYRHGLRASQPEVAAEVENETAPSVIDVRRAEQAATACTVAKFFGGKALTGTAQQKIWAEQIRANMLQHMTEAQALIACEPAGLYTKATFWIRNRSVSPQILGEMMEAQKALLSRSNELREQRRHDEYAAVAEQYNALTASLGFK